MILLTGFEHFGKYDVNPSKLVVKRLSGVGEAELPGVEIHVAILPVSFRRAGEVLRSLLDELKPDIYIGLGLWAGVSYVTVERVAINVMDARIPDNDGYQPIDEPIDPMGSLAYSTTLPKKAIVRRLREAGIPAAISNSAGTYICNYVLYLALHHSAKHGYPRRTSFMHLPLLPEQAVAIRGD